MKTCSIDSCDRKHLARGYCRIHYAHNIEQKRPRGPVIHLEDVEWMAETGETWTNAARRLGVQTRSLERRLLREGRQDLITLMRRRENGFAYQEVSCLASATSTRPTQGDTAA